jgi:hypothetical protein
MLFGDPADFAIEADVEPHIQPPSAVWGHMCVWCCGISLGDISSLHCGLSGTSDGFSWLVPHLDNLWAEELQDLDDLALWNFLDGLLYGYHGNVEFHDDRTLEECQQDSERWHRFDFLTNWDEPFNGYKAFIVCPPREEIRILYRRLSENVRVVRVSRAGFLRAASLFVKWFEAEEIRLASAGINLTEERMTDRFA